MQEVPKAISMTGNPMYIPSTNIPLPKGAVEELADEEKFLHK
jgi:hypothetical protein